MSYHGVLFCLAAVSGYVLGASITAFEEFCDTEFWEN